MDLPPFLEYLNPQSEEIVKSFYDSWIQHWNGTDTRGLATPSWPLSLGRQGGKASDGSQMINRFLAQPVSQWV